MVETKRTIQARLIAAHAKFKAAARTEKNPFFNSKYAPLDTVFAAVNEALAEEGLLYIQQIVRGPSNEVPYILVTSFESEDGTALVGSEYPLIPMRKIKGGGYERADDPQSWGGTVNYARRYAAMTDLRLAAEDDTDGEDLRDKAGNGKANPDPLAGDPLSPAPPPRQAPPPAAAPPKQPDAAGPPAAEKKQPPTHDAAINTAQRNMLFAKSRDAGLTEDQLRRLLVDVTGEESTANLSIVALDTIIAMVNNPATVAKIKVQWAKEDVDKDIDKSLAEADRAAEGKR
jgi:hypothetical protein